MREDILTLVYAAMDEVDPLTVNKVPLQKNLDAPLLGSDQGIDSLTFVNLVVALEEEIQRKLGRTVVLVDEDNMSLEQHPFRTVGTLAAYVETILSRD